ncbi:MAG: response regulator [Desulfobacterales bacterium]|nr:response regulator [Desulfobacterales bacterium]
MEPKTVLVVEDNELNMKLVRDLLRFADYAVIEAWDAETGLELAQTHQPDLILMDIQLPGMDGLTATQHIRRDANLKHTPVVALSSYAMNGDKQKALDAGCTGYLTKPIKTRSFIQDLVRIIGTQPSDN